MLTVEDINNFNADDAGVANGAYFGFPFAAEKCQLQLISVPWDVTVSYGDGTAKGPQAILHASTQIEIYDDQYPEAWHKGIATLEPLTFADEHNREVRKKARLIIQELESEHNTLEDDERETLYNNVNEACQLLNDEIYNQAKQIIQAGKTPSLVGGDHSTPLGLIKALAEKESFGILHLDAHMDLRDRYEGFQYSHASIMRNAIELPGVEKITQVAVRDYSLQEMSFAKTKNNIEQFTENVINAKKFQGTSWHTICTEIVETLPRNVYISFDIDALAPYNCPSTGTPVPGGLTFQETTYLLKVLHESGRKVVGFDLVEVGFNEENEWDANVGARILYKLALLTLAS